jgi:hypothetical protein
LISAFLGSTRIWISAGLVELVERRDDRQAADELGDQAELDQVLGLGLAQHRADVLAVVGRRDLGAEADAGLGAALADDLLEAVERAAADEQDVGRVDLDELLVRVLAAALRRDARDRALDELQQRLLHALARDVTRDRRVVALARDLVDLVDVDDAALRLVDVVVALLEQLLDDVLDVLADVARLGQRRRVRDHERDVEQARQRLGEQRLARAGRPDQQDVRLGELDVVFLGARLEPLVVVVDRDRQDLLGRLLPITYWSRIERISCGVGSLLRSPRASPVEAPSSRMMSLQSSMHSSQMNTDGPAMSFRTSCCDLPQNEQYSSLSLEDLSAIQRPR